MINPFVFKKEKQKELEYSDKLKAVIEANQLSNRNLRVTLALSGVHSVNNFLDGLENNKGQGRT